MSDSPMFIVVCLMIGSFLATNDAHPVWLLILPLTYLFGHLAWDAYEEHKEWRKANPKPPLLANPTKP
jgi:hypothetical protein